MSVDIHFIKCGDIFQNGFKIFHIAGGFFPAFKIRRIIGIISVHHMGRTNNKVKRDFFQKSGKRFGKMRLKSQFDSEIYRNLVPESISQFKKTLAVCRDIQ